MIVAAVRDNAYNVVLVVHLVAVVVTFAPAAVNPLLERHFQRNGGEPVLRNWSMFAAFYTSRIALPGLVVLLLTGVIMVLQSDDVYEFSQTWISLSFLVWIALGGVISAMVLKGERDLAAGNTGASSLLAKGGAIVAVLLVVMLYLMVFKPGF